MFAVCAAAAACHARTPPAGATPFRTKSIAELMDCKPTVIRGNAGEILAVCGATGTTKGVDSAAAVEDAHDAAKALARDRGCVVAISGEADFVRARRHASPRPPCPRMSPPAADQPAGRQTANGIETNTRCWVCSMRLCPLCLCTTHWAHAFAGH